MKCIHCLSGAEKNSFSRARCDRTIYSDYQSAFDSISVPRTAEDGDVVSTKRCRDREPSALTIPLMTTAKYFIFLLISVELYFREDNVQSRTRM